LDVGLTLEELAREIRGETTISGDPQTHVLGVQHDSRHVQPGDMFVVRKGATHDGRAFIADVQRRGAVALLVETGLDVETTLPVLRVPAIADGMAFAAAAVYGHPAFSLDIVGITGTNGKTTTTHLVRTAIDGAYGKTVTGIVGTVGHKFGNRTIAAAHTTPESDELARVLAAMRKEGATHIAMEVSSIALTLRRVAAVRFRVAAFTNLTQDHLDFHKSMDEYAAAKLELFTTLAPGLAVVNVDDPFGEKIAALCKCKTLRVRTRVGASDADVYPEAVTMSASGMTIAARIPGPVTGRVEFTTRLVGAHNVENLLIALGIVSALDLDVEKAAAALSSEVGAPGRLERCDGPGDDVVVVVDYAHTPDALSRAVEAVRANAKRVICIFGCGGDRDPTKRAPMGVAAAAADYVIVTSDNPRSEDPAAIAEAARAGVASTGKTDYAVELDRAKAIERGVLLAEAGDVVLIAGKGHEDYQIIGTEKRPFDDRVEARSALAKRRARKA
jgi:UDP-N-acetylmuramoyl-L-alanyl-D-glutamate--2,6-diaminopimelate ligase